MIINGSRMERYLEVWEDSWYLLYTLQTMREACARHGARLEFTNPEMDMSLLHFAKNEAPFHWREFRDYLRKQTVTQGPLAGIDPQFIGNRPQFGKIKAFDSMAQDLYGWCLQSKRVYHLEQDLQILLGATSMGKLTWADVELPFPCFAVQLEESIIHEQLAYDFIIVRHMKQNTPEGLVSKLCFTLVPQKYQSYKALTSNDRGKIRTALDRHDFMQASRLYVQYIEKTFSFTPPTFDVNNLGRLKLSQEVDLSVCRMERRIDVVNMPNEATVATMNKILRIVGGFCLYLKTLPSTSSHCRKVEAKPESIPRPGFTKNQELLLVTSDFKLSVSEREIMRDVRNEIDEESEHGSRGEYLEPRFRRGYWHRPRGQGQNPLHPKTEWTRPSVARPDLALKGILPKGSQTTVAI